jgi:predicted transcriptional regulator
MVADIAKHVLARNRSPERTNVYEIMSKPVLSVQPGMDIQYCARLFHRFGISTAPVIEGGQIKGIVSYDQLVLNGLARQS